MGWNEPPKADPLTDEAREPPADERPDDGAPSTMSGVGVSTNGNAVEGLGYDGRDEDRAGDAETDEPQAAEDRQLH